MMVGRLLSFWEGLFSGAMLIFRGVINLHDVLAETIGRREVSAKICLRVIHFVQVGAMLGNAIGGVRNSCDTHFIVWIF